MIRRLFMAATRILPRAIPVAILFGVVFIFWLQNHTTISSQGYLTVLSGDEMENRHPSRIAGDDDRFEPTESAIQQVGQIPVARKIVLTSKAGLSILNRGHSIEFVAVFPNFLSDTPFLKKLSDQIRNEQKRAAREFNSMNWWDVLDGIRDPQPYLQNWDASTSIEVIHLTSQSASLLESRSEYTGGAHGNYSMIGRSYVERSGQVHELKLDELFVPASDWKKRLLDHCLSDLRCQGASRISDVSVEESELYFSADDLASFTMSPSGIRFYFSPYHVGCYAEGAYTVNCPFEVVIDCISIDSPARHFMANELRVRTASR